MSLALVRTSLRGLKLPGNVLRRTAAPVDFDVLSDEQLRQLALGLFTAMYRGGGIGLAAPMVGMSLRAIVAVDEARPVLMFNPELVATGPGTTIGYEANLCMPGLTGEVERPDRIELTWLNLRGEDRQAAFTGSAARTLSHELELLDGRIFTDLAQPRSVKLFGSAQRAAAATAHVLDKPAKLPEPADHFRLSCLTLPPSLVGVESSVLRIPSRKVVPSKFKRHDLRHLVEAMFRVQYEQRGVGLAAPQVGLSLRLAVIDDGRGEPLVLLNPEQLEVSEELEEISEGCLSIPGWRAPVARATKIKLRNHTLAGTPYELTVDGHRARIVQHESDHLDGILYPQRTAGPEALVRDDAGALAEQALDSPSAS